MRDPIEFIVVLGFDQFVHHLGRGGETYRPRLADIVTLDNLGSNPTEFEVNLGTKKPGETAAERLFQIIAGTAERAAPLGQNRTGFFHSPAAAAFLFLKETWIVT